MAPKTTEEEEVKLPIHNVAAERTIAACLLCEGDQFIEQCIRRTSGQADYFYDEEAKAIFLAALYLHSEGKPIEKIGLQARLDSVRSGVTSANLKALEQEVHDNLMPASCMDEWLDHLHSNFLARKLASELAIAADRISPEVVQDVLNNLTRQLSSLSDQSSSESSVTGLEVVRSYNDYLQGRCDRYQSGKATGILSGWPSLDEYTDGFQYAEQAIIGARPSIGKTAAGCGIVCRACLTDDVPTLIVTMEMEINALVNRMFSAHHGVGMKALRRGQLTQEDFRKYVAFQTTLKKAPLHFVNGYSRGLSAIQIVMEIRRHARSKGVKLVLVDYLQKIKGVGQFEKKTYEIGEVSGALKSVAQETGVALVTLAQLNREPDKGNKPRPPRLSDLADSASIERDGDLIVLLNRNRRERVGKATFYVAKQRDGEIGPAEVWFNGEFCRFQNDDPERRDKPKASQPYND